MTFQRFSVALLQISLREMETLLSFVEHQGITLNNFSPSVLEMVFRAEMLVQKKGVKKATVQAISLLPSSTSQAVVPS